MATQTFADGALLLHTDQAIARLVLNRPDQRNAIGSATWQALPQALAAVRADPAVRVLQVQGAGGHFAAGADIAEFDRVFADRDAALHYARTMGTALDALAALPLPVLACIDGSCVGAGVALALACDLRWATADARFGVTPAKLGLMYPLRDTRRLVQAVGPAAAKDLLYTGRLVGAPQALSIGLADAVHADAAALQAAADAWCAEAAAASPWTQRHMKQVLALVARGQADDDAQTEAWFADAIAGADFREGVAAFRARRAPRFGLP